MKSICQLGKETIYNPENGWKLAEIEAFDAWWGRESIENCYSQVADVASLAHGNDGSKRPKELFESLVNSKPTHGEPLECIPFAISYTETIRPGSLRKYIDLIECKRFVNENFTKEKADKERKEKPALIFRIKCPKDPYIHLLRHGGTFGKCVMSRRKVTDKKVSFEFYGSEDEQLHEHYVKCVELYNSLVSSGVRPERARIVIPSSEMISFYYWGYCRDFMGGFYQQRVNPAPKVMIETKTIAETLCHISSSELEHSGCY